LEKENRTLQEENERLKEVQDKSDSLRLSLSRIEAMIKSQKDSIEKLRVELLSVKEIATAKRIEMEKSMK
jgi:hypothetical protein